MTVRELRSPWLSATLPFLAAVVLFFVTGLILPGAISFQSVRATLILASILGLVSVGQTLAIVTGGIDLSIPALLGMGDVLTVTLYSQGVALVGCFAIVLGLATTVGAVNAIASQGLRAHPLIVTLGTASIVTGGTLVYTSGFNSTVAILPQWLNDAAVPIGRTGPIPLPLIVVLWLALTAGVVFWEHRARLGHITYAVGANERAARLAALRPTVVVVLVYSTSGFLSGLAGIFLAGFSGGSDVYVGSPYLFTTVAAVVVGGTSLLGGRGGYGRTAGGVLLITVLTTLLIGLNLSEELQQMMLGGLIVAAVAAYGRQPHVRDQV